jgi:enolase
MYKIKDVKARQIFDSRGNPTIECTVTTLFGKFIASVPSGASTGSREAKELRDGSKAFNGLGVSRAVQNINEVLSVVVKGKDCRNQKEVDEALIKEDGTPLKEKIGANAILAVSLAVAKAGAITCKPSFVDRKNRPRCELFEYLSDISGRKPVLPIPALNIINGGKHAGNEIDFQEYQILPIKFKSFSEAFSAGVEVFHELKNNLKEKYGKSAINIGDEGGFAPQMNKVEEPIDAMLKAIESCGYAGQIGIGLDVAASSFAKDDGTGKTLYSVEGKNLSYDKLIEEYKALVDSYQIVSIEDPFDEKDFSAWTELTALLGKRVQILADDLTVSQKKIVSDSISEKRANALLLKVNQVGTLTEAIDSALTAFDAGWNVQVSHRSGETNDSFIADLAVGLGCGQIKSGAPCRGERLAKYNRLLKIESENKISFIGKKAFPFMK